MALYLIAFNDEWVPDLTLEELRERGKSGRAVIEEITAAGDFVFSDGGLDAPTVICSVVPSSGAPVSRMGRSSRPRSTSGVSRSSTCPTTPGAALGGQDRGRGRLASGGTSLPASRAGRRALSTKR